MKKILLVDDDASVLQLLARFLSQHGYQLVAASDAAAATQVARREKPALVILDLGIPAGGGNVVLERLGHLMSTLSTPVIILSGYVSEEARKSAIALGVVDFIEKPCDLHKLLAAVRRNLGEIDAAVEEATR